MTGMIEKVARAIMKESRDHLGAWPPKDIADELARAAIEAMREPTEQMIENGLDQISDIHEMKADYKRDAIDVWQTMIDATLKEEMIDEPA